jgi:microcystin-dependent protein
MSEPFLAEIRIFSFGFPPRGWAQCNGQLMQINQNQALFSLLGTTFGGNGQTTFALPDLRGRTPIHWGMGDSSHILGERGGEESHTLTSNELPAHTHAAFASSQNANQTGPANAVLASAANLYGALVGNLVAVGSIPPNAPTLSPVSGGQAHDNMMPFEALNFCIALIGIYPSRN